VSAWDDLVSAATVGIGGKALAFGDLDPAIAEVAAAVDRTDPVAAVFSIAALDTVAGRAGMSAGPSVQVVAPAPEDDRPVMTDRLAGLLGQALDSGEELATWAIETIAARDVRVPSELIPVLLQRTTRQVRIRPAVAVLVGERGRWLAEVSSIAAVLPAADAGAGPDVDPEELWSFGSTPARTGVLRRWRSADSTAGLQRLQEVWGSEPGDVRADLLAALDVGLSTADEPFLERALDDRKGSVRGAAARLLNRLPGSGLQQRMIDRARPILVASGRGRRLQLTLVLPDGADASARRDGIDPTAPRGTGTGAWLARQILQNTPLVLWENMFDRNPDELVGAVTEDAADVVLGAWADAAVAQHDARWARALYRWSGADPSLIGVLDPPVQTEAAIWWLRNRRPPGSVLPHLPAPWPDEVAAVALNSALRESISSSGAPPWHARSLVDQLRLGLPVGPEYRWIEQIDAVADRLTSGWSQVLQPLKWALTLRAAIMQAEPE
jgi:hypothetical protein